MIDDYGHHPTEIRATLAAARACNYKRIHVLFQPHRYTRTQALMDEFAQAFHQADDVHVLDIYAASENPIDGVSSQVLAERIASFGHRGSHYAGAMAAAGPGDAIITLGAGNVSGAAGSLLEELKNATLRRTR